MKKNNTKREYSLLKQGFRNLINIDKLVVIIVAFLSTIGIVTIYSITSVTMYNNLYDDPTKYVSTQILGIFLGVISVVVLLFIPYRLFKFIGFLAAWANPIIMFAILIIGTGPGGVKSWIKLGPLSFQPVEIVKIGLVLALAWFITDIKQFYCHLSWKRIFSTFVEPIPLSRKLKRWLLSPWGALAYTAVLLLLAMKQPDLGSGLILTGIGIVMVLSSGINWKTIIQLSCVVVIGFSAVWGLKDHLLETHQLNRFLMWRDPFAYEQDLGYQNIMGYMAIANGGLSGRGVGDSIQKYGYMSEPHNDFIVSIVGEELGLITIIMVILAYFFMGYKIMRTAFKTKDLFASLVCIGIGSSFILQAIINLGGVSGTIPLTGVTLPFISYGGTSALTSLLALGVYFNVASHIKEVNKRKKQAMLKRGIEQNGETIKSVTAKK